MMKYFNIYLSERRISVGFNDDEMLECTTIQNKIRMFIIMYFIHVLFKLYIET